MAIRRYGALHCLVNVAGVRDYQSLAAATPQDWEHILSVNVLGTAFCCKAANSQRPASRGAACGTPPTTTAMLVPASPRALGRIVVETAKSNHVERRSCAQMLRCRRTAR